MNANYPLRFQPLLRRYVWGGRKLQQLLGKSLPDGNDFAESWELVDHGPDQSVVAAGPLAGTTLHQLVTEQGAALLGRHAPQTDFPLLLKFLDAQRDLSLQVHPNDEQAARLPSPDRGKTEAWVVLDAEPGARIYAGWKQLVDGPQVQAALGAGQLVDLVHSFEPRSGDCVLVPAGTIHALGAGLVVAEIQQSSDTTFRLYDWGRVGLDGKPRTLHVAEGLAVLDMQCGPCRPVVPQPSRLSHVETLVECSKFVIDRWRFSTPRNLGGDNRCHLLVPLAGEVSVERDASAGPLKLGQTALLPAAAGTVRLEPLGQVVLLDIHLPDD